MPQTEDENLLELFKYIDKNNASYILKSGKNIKKELRNKNAIDINISSNLITISNSGQYLANESSLKRWTAAVSLWLVCDYLNKELNGDNHKQTSQLLAEEIKDI